VVNNSCICKMSSKGGVMEEVHQKLVLLNYPRASVPFQSLLYAGSERYTLLEWLFFRHVGLCLYVFFNA
jgi:hypothetical protein